MKKFALVFPLLTLLLVLFFGCRKDEFITDGSVQLRFSQDTVLFDTVFTTIGSTTQLLKVYNDEDQPVMISNIRLEGSNASNYRINVDGEPGVNFNGLAIEPEDSLFIFVEVTIDPGISNLPFIVEDQIVFETNGNTQFVQLASWGQNANFHGSLDAITTLPCDDVWNPDLPHVIYGIVAVDENCKLTINPGTQVYCHKGAGILVFRGCLEIQGALNNEVVFQGDRLEPEFQELPGQWGIELEFEFEDQFGVQSATVARGGIWFLEAADSRIDYAIMRNGTIGIQADTMKTAGVEVVQVTNTKIDNMSGIGLFGRGAIMSGHNNLITNCGRACGAFTLGGSYQFEHCTFANYWSDATRQEPAFVLNNFFVVNNEVFVRPLNNTEFKNCIMWGNNANLTDFNEFAVAIETDEFVPPAEYVFNNCSVDTDINLTDPTIYTGMVNAQSPPFVSPSAGNFRLGNNLSIWGGTSTTIALDLDGVFRTFPPTRGCYQFQ